jgi:hypothetical protein
MCVVEDDKQNNNNTDDKTGGLAWGVEGMGNEKEEKESRWRGKK